MLMYLRIAVTVLSLTACVLLIALWVRSFFVADAAMAPSRIADIKTIVVESTDGRIKLLATSREYFDEWYLRHESKIDDVAAASELRELPPIKSIPDFLLVKSYTSDDCAMIIPHWFPVLLSAVSAIIPWLRPSKRFSLRTLLVATALVAVVLGIIVAATKGGNFKQTQRAPTRPKTACCIGPTPFARRPERAKYNSPGQGQASSTSFDAALGQATNLLFGRAAGAACGARIHEAEIQSAFSRARTT